MASERALVVGAGGISGAWFPPLMAEKVNVVGVVDLKKSMAEARIKEYGLDALASTDLKAAINYAEGDLPDLTVTIPPRSAGMAIHFVGDTCYPEQG